MDTTLQYTLEKCDSNMKLFVKRLENNAYLTAMSPQAIWSLLHTNVENDLHNNLTMTFINIATISKVSNVKYSIFTCKTVIINMLHFKQKKNLIVIANNKH